MPTYTFAITTSATVEADSEEEAREKLLDVELGDEIIDAELVSVDR